MHPAHLPARNLVEVQWDGLLRRAQAAAEDLRGRLVRGEGIPDGLRELQDLIQAIIGRANAEPSSVSEAAREAIGSLVESVQSARQAGTAWMEQVAFPELEHLTRARTGTETYRHRREPS